MTGNKQLTLGLEVEQQSSLGDRLRAAGTADLTFKFHENPDIIMSPNGSINVAYMVSRRHVNFTGDWETLPEIHVTHDDALMHIAEHGSPSCRYIVETTYIPVEEG